MSFLRFLPKLKVECKVGEKSHYSANGPKRSDAAFKTYKTKNRKPAQSLFLSAGGLLVLHSHCTGKMQEKQLQT